jgi:hypothetical protein
MRLEARMRDDERRGHVIRVRRGMPSMLERNVVHQIAFLSPSDLGETEHQKSVLCSNNCQAERVASPEEDATQHFD